jgi:hypothetical protein
MSCRLFFMRFSLCRGLFNTTKHLTRPLVMASVRRMETKRLLPKVGILGVKPSGSDADPGPEMGE